MPTTFVFSAITDVDPLTQANPQFPAGYFIPAASAPARIGIGEFYASSGVQAFFVQSSALTGTQYSVATQIGASSSDSRGISLADINGNGYQLLVRNTDLRLFKMVAWVLGAQVGTGFTVAVASSANVKLGIDESTNTLTAYIEGVSVKTWVDATYPNVPYGGVFSRPGRLKSITTDQVAATPSITNINGDNTVVQGSVGNNILTALATVTSLTIGGIAVTLTPVDANNNAWPMPGFVDGAAYPAFGTVEASINGGEATRNVVLSMAAGYTARTMATLSTADDSIYTLALDQGLTMVPTGVLYNSAGLTTHDDSTISDANDGTHVLWYRAPITNVMTQINLLVADGAIVAPGLTLRATTARSLTVRSLTAAAI